MQQHLEIELGVVKYLDRIGRGEQRAKPGVTERGHTE